MRNRNLIRFFSCLLVLVLLLSGLPARTRAAERETIGRADHFFVEMPEYNRPTPPTINADTAILVELNSGIILYSQNINQRMFPASITKVMTALLAIEMLNPEDEITISYNAANDLIPGGFDGRFKPGQVFTTEEVIFGMNLGSVNTLAYALAEKMDGSVADFSIRMNERARELGAINTTFFNPHGLNDERHLTTAYDMAKVMWGAIELPEYRRIAGSEYYAVPANETHVAMSFNHTLRLLHKDNGWYDSRVVCGKTGWTEDADITRCIYASDGNLDLICVIFHSDTGDTAESDVEALLNYGFDNFCFVEIPDFGGNAVMEGMIDDGEGGSQEVLFHAGAGTCLSGAACLVPNDYATKTWTLNIYAEPGSKELVGRACLGGVPLASYDVTMTTVKKNNDLFPTTRATEPEGESSTQVSAEASQTQPVTEGGSAAESSSEEARRGILSDAGSWNKILPIALAVAGGLLVLSLAGIILLAQQNRRLKKRVERRKLVRNEE